jgi:hypothetical protein
MVVFLSRCSDFYSEITKVNSIKPVSLKTILYVIVREIDGICSGIV